MSEQEETPQTEKKPGVLGKARKGADNVRRLYVWSLFGDVKGFVAERKAFGSWLMRSLQRRTDGRKEDFDDAMRRLKLTEDDVIEKQASLERISLAYGAVAVIAFGFLLFSPFVAHPLSQFFVSLGLFVLMAARCVASRFRIGQIRARRFMSFIEWIKG